MADEDLTEEQIRKMEAKLLGETGPRKKAVVVQKSRKVERPASPKPYIEATPFKDSIDDRRYRVELVTTDGKRLCLFEAIYEDELQTEIKRYQADGSEVRIARPR